MVVSEHWRYQGRQYHQWFGHGTAPREEKEAGSAKPGSLFDPLSVGQRVDYLTGSVIAHSPRDERSRWEARLSGASRDSLKTAVAVWYGASGMSRDGFRQKLLDPSTADETVDQGPPTQRDRHLAMIAEQGRLAWQTATDYGRRSLVETTMGRYKSLIGPRLRARGFAAQQTEAAIGVAVLNQMLAAGRPDSVRRQPVVG